jgi:hypothetical protein
MSTILFTLDIYRLQKQHTKFVSTGKISNNRAKPPNSAIFSSLAAFLRKKPPKTQITTHSSRSSDVRILYTRVNNKANRFFGREQTT